MAAPNQRENKSNPNFPEIPNGHMWNGTPPNHPTLSGWWHINREMCMMAKIDENGDQLPSGINHEASNMEEMLANVLPMDKWPKLRLRRKSPILMRVKYNRNLLSVEDCSDNDILWEQRGLNYLKNKVFFAEENACPDWKKFDVEKASLEECIFHWRRIGKIIRQFGMQCGSDQYEDYFIDEIENNHAERKRMYEEIKSLENLKKTLPGKVNKRRRKSANKKIEELRKNARLLPYAPKILFNKGAPDFEIRRQLFSPSERKDYFRFCSFCDKGMTRGNYKRCPCKTAWYCSKKCQKKDWKKGHKNVCTHVVSVTKIARK